MKFLLAALALTVTVGSKENDKSLVSTEKLPNGLILEHRLVFGFILLKLRTFCISFIVLLKVLSKL